MTPRLRLLRRAVAAALLLSGLLVGLLSATAGAHSGHGAVVILEVDGVIDRPVAGYLLGAIEQTQSAGHVEALVLQLDSPGALKADIDAVAEAMRASRVPIVVWVPPGGRAAGGAFTLFQRAHLRAASLGAVLGPLAPQDLADGEPQGDAVVVVPPDFDPDRLPADVAPDGVALLTEEQVVDQGTVAFTAPTLPDVLRELDGRQVEVDVLGRQTLEVDPVTADVRFENMGLGRRILHAVASPALAYLLVVGGALALVFEIFQPGFGVSGITGVALMALGAYGFTVLPVNRVGGALLVLGLAVLTVDLSLAGFGVLTGVGAIALTAGSLLVMDADALRLSPWLVGFVVVSTLVFFVIVMTVVLRAQAGQAQEGADKVVGKRAVVRSMLNPEGHVFVDGALWRARAPEGAGKVKTGTVVRIVGLDDRLTLQVELDDEQAQAEATASGTAAAE